MAGSYHRTRADNYEHSIFALLAKRQDLLTEAKRLRERTDEIGSDVEALDRTLKMLGYEGNLGLMKPRRLRHAVFYRSELLKAVLDLMREAKRPMTGREIATAVAEMQGNNSGDKRYLADLTKRVGKAIKPLRDAGTVASAADQHGNTLWRLVQRGY